MNSWQVILHNTHAVPALCDWRGSGSSRTTTTPSTESSEVVKNTADYINGSRLEKTQHRRRRGRRRRRTTIPGVPPPLTLVASPSTQRSFWQRYSRLRASKSHIRSSSTSRRSRATAVRTNRPVPHRTARSPRPAAAAIAATRRTLFCYTAAV